MASSQRERDARAQRVADHVPPLLVALASLILLITLKAPQQGGHRVGHGLHAVRALLACGVAG